MLPRQDEKEIKQRKCKQYILLLAMIVERGCVSYQAIVGFQSSYLEQLVTGVVFTGCISRWPYRRLAKNQRASTYIHTKCRSTLPANLDCSLSSNSPILGAGSEQRVIAALTPCRGSSAARFWSRGSRAITSLVVECSKLRPFLSQHTGICSSLRTVSFTAVSLNFHHVLEYRLS